MITKEQVPQLIGRPMFDSSHHKVGDVGQVYLDTASGEPEWDVYPDRAAGHQGDVRAAALG